MAKKVVGMTADGKELKGKVNASNIVVAISNPNNWKKTHKQLYDVYVCKPPIGTQVNNIFEGSQYVTNEQKPFILSGTQGEQWVIDEGKLTTTYVTQGIKLRDDGYLEWTRITTRQDNTINWAFHVPLSVQNMPVQTSWGDILYANRTGVKHGSGDFLVCSDAGGRPNLQDVWIVNGMIFPNTYDLHNFGDEIKNSIKNTNTPVPTVSLLPKMNKQDSVSEFSKLKELARKLAESLKSSYKISHVRFYDDQGYIQFEIDSSKKPKFFVLADFNLKSESTNNFDISFTLMTYNNNDCEEVDARHFEQSKTGSITDFLRKSRQAIDNLFKGANNKDLDTLYDGIAFTREVATQLTALFKYEGLSSDLESDLNVHYRDNVKYKLHLGWLGSLAKDSTGRDNRTSDSVVIFIKYDADTKKIVYNGRHKGKELKNEFVDISKILELQNELGTADFSMGYVVVLIMYLTICKEMNITPYRFITKAPYLHAVSAYVNSTDNLNFLESTEKVRIAVNNKTIQSEYNKENSVASTKYLLGIFYGKDTSPKYTYECRVNVRLNKQMILRQISEYKKCIENKTATIADVEKCLSECSFKGTIAAAYGKVIDLELPSGSYIPYFAHALQEAILSEWKRQKGITSSGG